MKTRVITSVFITAIMLAVLILSGTLVYPITLSIIATVAVYEVLKVFGIQKKLVFSIPSYLVAALMPTLAYVMRAIMGRAENEFIILLALILFVLMIYMFAVAVFTKGAVSFSTFAAAFVMVFYITVAFSALSILRTVSGDVIGFLYVGLVIIGAWISDVFAYFTGVLFGKHKLIPEVSPKKTVEGSVGAIVFTTLFMLLYGFIASLVTDVTPNYLVLAISGPVLSVVGQIGDLFASVVKRERGVKDYGTLMPGHGGIMDRFDSILAVSCATMVIVLIFPPFV